MNVLASLTGSSIGLVVIAMAAVLGRFIGYLPKTLGSWAARGIIVMMYAGGSVIAVTQLGAWADHGVNSAAAFLGGGLGAGAPRTALVITALFLVVSLAVSFVYAPSPSAGVMAAMMPFVLSLVTGGVLHELYASTTGPAQALAASLSSWLGG